MEAAAVGIVFILWAFIALSWFLFVLTFYFVVFGLFISILILWVVMLVDCVQREFPKPDDKTVWILVVVLTGWIGALIYYFMIKRPADQLASVS